MREVVRAAQYVEGRNVLGGVEEALKALVAACAVLDPDDVRVFGQLGGRRRLDGIAGAARDVVEEHGNRHRIGDCAVVVDQFVLLERHEIRRDDRDRVDAHGGDGLAQLDRC